MRLISARISSRSSVRKESVPSPIAASFSPLEGMALVISGSDSPAGSAASSGLVSRVLMLATMPASMNSRREKLEFTRLVMLRVAVVRNFTRSAQFGLFLLQHYMKSTLAGAVCRDQVENGF